MLKMTVRLSALLLACVIILTCCATDIVFVEESLNADGDARQMLKLTESIEADAAYFDGDKWVIIEDVEIPAGWLVITPRLADPKGESPEDD